MDIKAKPYVGPGAFTVIMLIGVILPITVVVLVVRYYQSSKENKDNYSNCDSKAQIRENFPASVTSANVLYTDQDGNLGATSDLVLNSLNASTIYQGGNVLIPRGVIVMWSGDTTNIPAGWALCNNTNNTPDLSGKFIVGVGSNGTNTYSVSNPSGGRDSVTLTVGQIPSHSHTVTDPGHTHQYNTFSQVSGNNADSGGDVSAKDNNSRTVSASQNSTTGITIQSTGEGQAIDIRPKYYALCYIMKL